jgi:prepilin-type N-terminal cleavage/methylation domain-containing protein
MKVRPVTGKNHAVQSAGFTLVEVLISIAILSILFGTIYRTFDIFNRSYTSENVKSGVQQKTRIGIDLMARDIRLAGLDPLGSASAGLTFTYLDAADTPLAEPIPVNQIRTVLISLTMQREAGRGGSVRRTYTTRIRCRNL